MLKHRLLSAARGSRSAAAPAELVTIKSHRATTDNFVTKRIFTTRINSPGFSNPNSPEKHVMLASPSDIPRESQHTANRNRFPTSATAGGGGRGLSSSLGSRGSACPELGIDREMGQKPAGEIDIGGRVSQVEEEACLRHGSRGDHYRSMIFVRVDFGETSPNGIKGSPCSKIINVCV